MGDVLNQDEVESLLNAMESSTAEMAGQGSIGRPRGEKVVAYDFKRPERVGKEQMQALQSLHEGFGRNFGAAISGVLRSIVEVKLTSVDQLTYSEFVFSLENPTCFNLVTAEPLEGSLILDISPAILYPIIDRMLGGSKEGSQVARRPLTEIELRLVRRLTDLFLQELKVAWENVLPLTLSVDRVESNPQLVQIVPPNEVVILISFELTLGDVRGMMNLCIPFNSIERISGKLQANTWAGYSRTVTPPEEKQRLASQLNGALVELVVTLAETNIRTQDILELRVGDIITTETDRRQTLDVAVEDVAKFRAHPGALKGRKAIRVETDCGVQAAVDSENPAEPS